MLMTPYTTSGAASMRISLSMLLYSMAFSYLVATLVAPDCTAPLLHAQPLVALFGMAREGRSFEATSGTLTGRPGQGHAYLLDG